MPIKLRARQGLWVYVPANADFLMTPDKAAEMCLRKLARPTKLAHVAPVTDGYDFSATFPEAAFLGTDDAARR